MTNDTERARAWVVEFVGCTEAVIRTGPDPASVSAPDDLGCMVRRVRPLSEVRLRSEPWVKNGEWRCTPVEEGA